MLLVINFVTFLYGLIWASILCKALRHTCCIHFEGLVRGIAVYIKIIKLWFKKYRQVNNWSYPKQEKKKERKKELMKEWKKWTMVTSQGLKSETKNPNELPLL